MNIIDFQVEKPQPFRTRMRMHLWSQYLVTLVFTMILIGFRILIRDQTIKMLIPVAALLLFVIAVIIQYRIAINEEKWYITHLKIDNDVVDIEYLVRDESFSISGTPDEFVFRKKNTLGRTGSTYQSSVLEIYYQDKLFLKQYSSDDWTDLKFIEIVHNFNQMRLV